MGMKCVKIALDQLAAVFACSPVKQFKHGRNDIIVRFDNPDVFAPGKTESLIHAVAITGILLVQDNDPGILCRIFRNDRRTGVGGTIVDADDFDLLQSLADDRIQTLAQIAFHIINRDQNGNSGTLRRFPPAAGTRRTACIEIFGNAVNHVFPSM